MLFTEGEDEDIEWATEVLTEAATVEHNKHEDQELFFFFGGDVSPQTSSCYSDKAFYAIKFNKPL